MMKRPFYMLPALLSLSLGLGACGEKDQFDGDAGDAPLKGVALAMDEPVGTGGATVRATLAGYSVNTANDPTSSASTAGAVPARGTAGWKLDFTLFNGSNNTLYAPACFTAGSYNATGRYWAKEGTQLFFPNYRNPRADLLLYPGDPAAPVERDQSDAAVLLKQDILLKTKEAVRIAHEIIVKSAGGDVALIHKRVMLDLVLNDLVKSDINMKGGRYDITVWVGADAYIPCKVAETASSLEYMLILPEDTNTDPVVEIVTKATPFSSPITYRKPIGITNGGTTAAGGNRCYCATLLGNELQFSPVIVADWTTGEPVSGEYVAVTAYPTFKGPVNTTFFFYYDNRLVNPNGTPRLQPITFNNEGECTVKTDGRTITHIFKTINPSQEDWDTYRLDPPIILGNTEKMYINLDDVIQSLP